MAHISFKAERLGPANCGEATVKAHPKGSILSVNGAEVARLGLPDSDYVRNSKENGLTLRIYVEHVDDSGVYGHFEEAVRTSETETSWVGPVLIGAAVLAAIVWAVGMLAIKIGVL